MTATVKLKDKNQLRNLFTREVADDLFYFLMPEYADPESAEYQKVISKLKRPQAEEFQQSVMDRSTLDKVESFNRIPSDRAQDAIVYFLEEVLGLEEQRSSWRMKQLQEDKEENGELFEGSEGSGSGGGMFVGKTEGHRKVLDTYPDRDDLEETYTREYILVRDSEGLLFRLMLSHTFLKVEKKYKRPNVTKTKKNLAKGKPPEKAAAYQRFWRPIRVKTDYNMGATYLVDYPEKDIFINTQTGKVSIIEPDESLVEAWSSAKTTEIGKQNIIALAKSLRNACYQIKFEGGDPYTTFMKSDIMKLFMKLNEIFDSLGSKVEYNVFGLDEEKKAISQRTELDMPLPDANPFAKLYKVKQTEYYSLIPNSTVFKIDAYNEDFVLKMLNKDKGIKLDDYKKEYANITRILEKKPFPGPKQGLTRPYRSIFAFPQARLGMIVSQLKTETEITPKLLQQTPSGAVVGSSQTLEVQKDLGSFFFQLDNRAQLGGMSKNECSFLFSDHVQEDFGSEGDTETAILDILPEGRWALAGQIYYPNEANKDFTITLTDAFLNQPSGLAPATINLDTIRLFNDFITRFGEMYFQGNKTFALGKSLAKADTEHTNLNQTYINQIISELGLNKDSSGAYIKALSLAPQQKRIIPSTPIAPPKTPPKTPTTPVIPTPTKTPQPTITPTQDITQQAKDAVSTMNQMAQDQQLLSNLLGGASVGAFSSLAPPLKSQATSLTPTQSEVTQEEIKGGGNAAADSIFGSGVVIDDLEDF